MWRVIVFVILFGQCINSFYAAYFPERSALAKGLPIKNSALRKKVLIGGGLFFLFLTLLLVYATVMQAGPRN